MTRHPLQLTYGPDPIFRKKATAVAEVDDGVRETVEAMFDLLYREKGVGIGANMAGLLQRIVVIDLQEEGARQPLALINRKSYGPAKKHRHSPKPRSAFPASLQRSPVRNQSRSAIWTAKAVRRNWRRKAGWRRSSSMKWIIWTAKPIWIVCPRPNATC